MAGISRGILTAVLALHAGWSCSKLPGGGLCSLTSGHLRLIRALEDYRPAQARLVGFESHMPCPTSPETTAATPPRCAALPAGNTRPYRWLAAAGELIRQELRRGPTASRLHAQGIWEVVWSDSADSLDDALRTLERAANLAPGNALVMSDLAAVQLIRSRATDDTYGLLASLEWADRAIEVDPGLRPALFNRALTLGGLSLRDEALRAWDAYLETESVSDWAAEAAGYRSILTRPSHEPCEQWRSRLLGLRIAEESAMTFPIASDCLDQLQEFLEEELMSRWARSTLLEDGRTADPLLHAAREMADALAGADADPMPLEVTEAMMASTESQRRELAGAFSTYQKGLASYRRRDLLPAQHTLDEARRDLERLGSPFALWAAYYRAVCDYWEDSSTARSELLRLRSAAVRSGYLRLLGHVEWMLGLIEVEEGFLGRGVASYEKAWGYFDRARLPGQAAYIRALMADALFRNGQTENAWLLLSEALAHSAYVTEPAKLQAAWSLASEMAQSAGYLRAAVYFENQALAAALETRRETTISDAFRTRALLRSHLEQRETAIEDVEASWRWMEKIRDPKARRRTEAVLLEAASHVGWNVGGRYGVDLLSGAIEYQERTRGLILLPSLLFERARLHLDAGEVALAEGDLEEAIILIERQEPEVRRPIDQASYLATVRSTYEKMVELLIDHRRDPQRALGYAERSRDVPVAPGARRPGPAPEPALADVLADLGTDTAVITTFALPDRWLGWVIAGGQVTFKQHRISSSRIREIVNGIEDQLASESPGPTALEGLSELHELLVTPFRQQLAARRRLVFVLDSSLGSIPVAALYDSQAERFLIESYTVLTAPEVRSLRQVFPGESSSPATVLSIGDPAFDSADHPGLPRLPGSRREAEQLKDLYPEATVLVAEAATKQRILAELSGRQVVHFAGHAFLHPSSPEFSGLVTASGTIFAREILEADLTSTRLVVLAACRSGATPHRIGGRLLALSHPFLEAGAASVLVTLWPVEDEATRTLLRRFYEHYAGGLTADEALRRAQLESLSGRGFESLSEWAPFQLTSRLLP